MNDFELICTHVSDLARFAALPYQTVERGLAIGMQQCSAAQLESRLAPVRGRLERTLNDVKLDFVDRNEAIDAIGASITSGIPAVLLGPPGTAKSAIVREVARRCGLGTQQHGEGEHEGGYFEYLLTSHTMPEELFGMANLKRMTEESIFERNIRGMLPEAHLAFLDEVFRGGGHILNTLLSLLNERLFHDGQTLRRVPLVGVVAASNEPPLDPDLRAFFDRFPIRIWLDSIFQDRPGQDVTTPVNSLLRASARHESRSLMAAYRHESAPASEQSSCMSDFRCGRAIVTSRLRDELVTGNASRADNERAEEFLDLYRAMYRPAGLSDRTLFALRRFAEALSWLTESGGGTTRRVAHFRTFRFLAKNAHERQRFDREVHDAMQGSGLVGTE